MKDVIGYSNKFQYTCVHLLLLLYIYIYETYTVFVSWGSLFGRSAMNDQNKLM